MPGRRKTGQNRLFHEVKRETERRRSSPELDADPVAVLQEVLDGAVGDLRFAQEQVDRLELEEVFRQTPANGAIPNEWIRLRDHYREELERVANNPVKNGLAKRLVDVKVAQAALVVQAVQAAAIDAGIPPGQVRALGAALRRRLDGSPLAADAAADLAPLHQLTEGDPE